MKFLKVTTSVTVELVAPTPDATQEEIDELMSEKGQKEFYEGALAEAKANAKASNASVTNFEAKAEFIDI